jgi:protein-tyrosine phosphatase
MIDIHSHILPGIDDGAFTIDDSLELCQYAVNNGITHVLATPHIHPGRYNNDKISIEKALNYLKKELTAHQIPLQISSAAEVRISVEMMEMIIQDKVPFIGKLNGFNYILLEMPHSHILPGSDKLITWLKKRNIKVIIAHPERNKEIQHDISKLSNFIKQGCLLQLTAASVAGKFGEICQEVSKQLINNHWVSFLATDAHNMDNRPPDLKQGLETLSEWIGKEKASKMVYNNQKLLTSSHFDKLI